MLRQAQQLQQRMARLQEEMAGRTVESSVGGGVIKVVANGKQEVVSVTIDREVVNPEDVEMLQDLIISAVNDALKKSQEMMQTEMSKLTGGFKMPGIF
jgi:DNA-binding YbaB/EbfC family protein